MCVEKFFGGKMVNIKLFTQISSGKKFYTKPICEVKNVVTKNINEIERDTVELSGKVVPNMKDWENVKYTKLSKYPIFTDLLKQGLSQEEALAKILLERDSACWVDYLVKQGEKLETFADKETGEIIFKIKGLVEPSRGFAKMPNGDIVQLESTPCTGMSRLNSDIRHIMEEQQSAAKGYAARLGKVDENTRLNMINEYVNSVGGFEKCNKTITLGETWNHGEQVKIIYDGIGCCIAEDGRIIMKVPVQGSPKYVDTEELVKEHARLCSIQAQLGTYFS